MKKKCELERFKQKKTKLTNFFFRYTIEHDSLVKLKKNN